MKAFLGTGLLGANFTKALLKKGEQVQVWNRTASKAVTGLRLVVHLQARRLVIMCSRWDYPALDRSAVTLVLVGGVV